MPRRARAAAEEGKGVWKEVSGGATGIVLDVGAR